MDVKDRVVGLLTDQTSHITHKNVFTPDVVGALDYTANHGRGHARTGEERLLLALIEDAIKRLQANQTKAEGGTKAQREAEAWLRGSTDEGALSFDFCCEHLGMDADYLRHGLGLDQPYNPARHLRLVKHLKPRLVLGCGGPVAQRAMPWKAAKSTPVV